MSGFKNLNELKNYLRGKQAKQNGNSFEAWLEKAFARAGWDLLRIHDGCEKIGRGGRKIIPIKQAFDFVAFGPERRVIYFDAKHRANMKNVRPSIFTPPRDPRKSKTLANQLQWLKRIKNHGHQAGFMVYLSAVDEVHWVDRDDCISGKSTVVGSFASGRLRI